MAKIARNFRLEETTLDKMDKLVKYYNEKFSVYGLFDRTKIIEYLVQREFDRLREEKKIH